MNRHNKGWYGEHHRHYLAAKGIKTNKHYSEKETETQEEFYHSLYDRLSKAMNEPVVLSPQGKVLSDTLAVPNKLRLKYPQLNRLSNSELLDMLKSGELRVSQTKGEVFMYASPEVLNKLTSTPNTDESLEIKPFVTGENELEVRSHLVVPETDVPVVQPIVQQTDLLSPVLRSEIKKGVAKEVKKYERPMKMSTLLKKTKSVPVKLKSENYSKDAEYDRLKEEFEKSASKGQSKYKIQKP